MPKIQKGGEAVSLSFDEMDIVFAALETLQKSVKKVENSAAELRAEDAAIAASRFDKQVEELKQKFLH